MKIIIPGIPIPKARHKACRRGQFISIYDPQETQKKAISLIIKSQFPHPPIETCCSVSFLFYFPFPKDYLPWTIPFHTGKIDLDNLVKMYGDCSNKILFHDDKQIVEIYAKKLYSEQPRTEIEIMPIDIPECPESVMKIMKIFDPTTLKEFIHDLQELISISKELSDSVNLSLLPATASALSSFSNKYIEKLKKVQKINCPFSTPSVDLNHAEPYHGQSTI